jgi:hypothetical protein
VRWPWVKRSLLNFYRRSYNDATRQKAELTTLLAENRGAREELQSALRRSETERTDLQTRLLRVGYGYPPFHDKVAAAAPQDSTPAAPPKDFTIHPDMTEDEVRLAFTQEAMHLYGGNMRAITNHVELKQQEYYQFRHRPPVLSHSEAEAAAKVAADIESAIEEGRRAARSNQ